MGQLLRPRVCVLSIALVTLIVGVATVLVIPSRGFEEAIRAGDLRDVTRHVMFGADVDGVLSSDTDDALSPLCTAIVWGQYDVARYLISKGADVNVSGGWLRPLRAALMMDNVPDNFISLLLKQGAEIDDDFEIGSMAMVHPPVILRELIGSGLDIGARSSSSYKQMSLLHVAAYSDADPACTAMLLDSGLPPSVVDEDGVTPLHMAARSGNVSVARVLLGRGADPNAASLEGNTPLHFAAWGRNMDVYNLLAEFGGDVDLRNAEGRSPAEALQMAIAESEAQETCPGSGDGVLRWEPGGYKKNAMPEESRDRRE